MQSYVRMAAVTPSATILACGPHSADHRHPRPIDQRGGPGAAEQQWGSTAKTNTEVQTPPPSAIENTAGLWGGGGGKEFGPRCCELRLPELLLCDAVVRRDPGGPQPHCCECRQGQRAGGYRGAELGPDMGPPTRCRPGAPAAPGGAGFGGVRAELQSRVGRPQSSQLLTMPPNDPHHSLGGAGVLPQPTPSSWVPRDPQSRGQSRGLGSPNRHWMPTIGLCLGTWHSPSKGQRWGGEGGGGGNGCISAPDAAQSPSPAAINY